MSNPMGSTRSFERERWSAQHDIPPVKGVQALMDKIGARGHVTFGGRLAPDAKGFPASAMAKNKAGDWRDPTHVRSWVHDITADLRASARGAA